MKKNLLVTSLVLLGGLGMSSTASATIAGTAHDFSAETWTENTQICLPCHAPHNNNNAVNEILWNHADTTQTFAMYKNPSTMDADIGAGQPSGVSMFCLSCHDGITAMDAYNGHTPAPTTIGAVPANLGTDLTDDHPISIEYLSATDSGLVPIASLDATVTPLFGAGSDTVECASCHDVHNKHAVNGGVKLLNYTMAGSALCLQCHAK